MTWHGFIQDADIGEMRNHEKILVRTGTLKTGNDTYAKRLWSRGLTGIPTIVYNPKKQEAIRFDYPEHALRFMYGAKHMQKLEQKWAKLKAELGSDGKTKKGNS